ncbi:MAG: FAD-linked oxidase C-terminal domain-containing protein [Alphaproteobacteria bacterium]
MGATHLKIQGGEFAKRLQGAVEGEVYFDAFSRGRYATDASIYQMEPLGVVVPKTPEDVEAAFAIAGENEVPILARGGGTSQCGQTVNVALVIDTSKYLDRVVSLDPEGCRVVVQPGLVLDQLNEILRPYDLWFPVDISTSSQATIGGMAGNNSCGARSIRYGTMRDNVVSIGALLANGQHTTFGEVRAAPHHENPALGIQNLTERLLKIGRREASEIEARFPKLMRRVGGYNIDALTPDQSGPINLAHVLVGSEGTLAFFEKIELALSPLPRSTVLGICHFPSFYEAMVATKAIVSLEPTAVELVDRTLIDLARDIDLFRNVIAEVIQGEPEAVLLVEFAETEEGENLRRLEYLRDLMGDLGYDTGMVEVIAPQMQRAVWGMRKQGLNIVMSMKGDGKPVSFVEDCAVELEDLPEYTARLDAIFQKYNTRGTWYAHASVGTLHVRPVLNVKLDQDVKKMRAIAEEAFALVREYKGSHSGEHGDGIARSEFHESMFGGRIVSAFQEVKRAFDPENRLNPGRIVDPPRMDDRSLFRFKPDYRSSEPNTAFDWSLWGGFSGAVEMCNNNGACRKLSGGTMCPSFRATRDEQHSTRGRANALRLALSGQLGSGSITSSDMAESLKLCVGCKACRRECPTGVDMAKMKIEVMRQQVAENGLPLRDRLFGFFPRYAPWMARAPYIANLQSSIVGSKMSEWLFGLAANQPLPHWARQPFNPASISVGHNDGPEVLLFADCFNRYFEPDNLQAAVDVLVSIGRRVRFVAPVGDETRPLCCGRTFLSVGLVEEARQELTRLVKATAEWVDRGIPVVGLEPSCVLTLRDELPELIPNGAELASKAMFVEEYLVEEHRAGRLALDLRTGKSSEILVHGHCHQKAANAFSPTIEALQMIPDVKIATIESTCCGMAGSFGYQADTQKVARNIGELDFLPAIREASEDTIIVADGTSCRHQVASATERKAHHAIAVIRDVLPEAVKCGRYTF